MVRDRQKEIGRLAEGKPSEIRVLSSLNVGDYFETTTMSYLYQLEISKRNKEQEDKVEKAKNDKFSKGKVGKNLPPRLSK